MANISFIGSKLTDPGDGSVRGESALAQEAVSLEVRANDEPDLSHQMISGQQAYSAGRDRHAAVHAVIPVISHDEQMIFGNYDFRDEVRSSEGDVQDREGGPTGKCFYDPIKPTPVTSVRQGDRLIYDARKNKAGEPGRTRQDEIAYFHLLRRLTVEKQLAGINPDPVPWKPNDPFDDIGVCVPGSRKDHHIAPFRQRSTKPGMGRTPGKK